MYQIQLKFKGQSKKITVGKSLPTSQLQKLIAQCFSINEKIIGVTNKAGFFLQLNEFNKLIPTSNKQKFALVTAKDINQDSMSFASQYYQKPIKHDSPHDQDQTQPTLSLPDYHLSKCVGIITDLEIFEQLCLGQGITMVACFTKIRPTDSIYDYYLYPNQSKNSLIVYSGHGKVCQFYVSDWDHPNPQINMFLQGIAGEPLHEEASRSGEFKKREKIGEAEAGRTDEVDGEVQAGEIKQQLVQKFQRLHEEGELSELQFYKLKSQVLENPLDFMRKYQMGTRQGLPSREGRSRGENRQGRVQQGRDRGRSGNRAKRYQIPIIVRKYNNVVQKISTSYPLTLQQQRAINLILEIELKGLISQKQAGKFKSLILQQDIETFKIFRQYFEDRIDQIELASRLRKKKGSAGQQIKQRVEHNMRLLIKYTRQNNYQLLRKLTLEQNKHVLGALETYRANKNVEQLSAHLDKIANYYRAKEDLEDVDH